MAHFAQCELQRHNTVVVSWVPSTFARVGKFVKLLEEDGWEVKKVFSKVDYDISQEETRWGVNLPKEAVQKGSSVVRIIKAYVFSA